MNKQQLAAKIWESANQMRSKIEANEYKDYILGFIFYKYLSEYEVKFAKKEGFTDEDIKHLSEDDTEAVEHIRSNIGYFIAYKDLFSTWLAEGSDFGVGHVHDALSAFNRLISPAHTKLFTGIFGTLETGLSKLGENAATQTKAISELIHLIKDIPMDGKQDYDVLGFIYEYLIEKFAANAGKKAGEFYTPHEVSLLMSDIVAHHLQDRKEIQIYDPTSGSGSLLINIGKSISRYMHKDNNIKYFAQELKQNTYNLTRMNLVMRGILPTNIVTRNGDTLAEDWPYFDETDPTNSYNPLYVDAVVSNPPYSQAWDPTDKGDDVRYARFGLAPKSKADFAFLLHDLYHLRPDGIMAIVLPHGVLFRGGEEGAIRKNLIENDNIDAIIGLPANIFFGTGIPTVILILKQKREADDVLVIDASKGFEKVGKNNKLRASDIKRIVDTYITRQDVDKFAKVVSKQELRDNEYNLNIPRYVDSAEEAEQWDIYATMFGGVPNSEIDVLNKYWTAFPSLREELFNQVSAEMSELKVEDIKATIQNNADVKQFIDAYQSNIQSLDETLKTKLIANITGISVARVESELAQDIFNRVSDYSLVDKYEAYQLFNNEWQEIAGDIEVLQTEGLAVAKQVDANMVEKKPKGKVVIVQEGWKGHVFPFDLVQRVYLGSELEQVQAKSQRLAEITSELEEILESLTEETKDTDICNEAKDAFANKELEKVVKEIQVEIKKGAKYNEDDDEYKLIRVQKLLNEEKSLKKEVKQAEEDLHLLTKATIEQLRDEQVNVLLEAKWIAPLITSLNDIPNNILEALVHQVRHIADKYASTLVDVSKDIQATQDSLITMMDELTGSDHDIQGLRALQNLLKS